MDIGAIPRRICWVVQESAQSDLTSSTRNGICERFAAGVVQLPALKSSRLFGGFIGFVYSSGKCRDLPRCIGACGARR